MYNYQDDNFNNLTKSNTQGFMPYPCIANIHYLNAMYLFPHCSKKTKGSYKILTSRLKYRATNNGYRLSRLSIITRPYMTNILNFYIHALYLYILPLILKTIQKISDFDLTHTYSNFPLYNCYHDLSYYRIPCLSGNKSTAACKNKKGEVQCSSSNGQRSICIVPQAELVLYVDPKVLTDECEPGQTYGRHGNEIWVSGKCGGKFEICYREGNIYNPRESLCMIIIYLAHLVLSMIYTVVYFNWFLYCSGCKRSF